MKRGGRRLRISDCGLKDDDKRQTPNEWGEAANNNDQERNGNIAHRHV
jgi:hypothetical protein